MHIKLNLKSIIAFENFTNKSFNEIDYTSDDFIKLLYCCVLNNNKEIFTYDEFLEVVENKIISNEITDKFQKEIKLIEQFNNKKTEEIIEEKSDEKHETTFIKDVVAMLVVSAGISIDYVMNEMKLNEIYLFMTAYNEKVKQEMEQNRLWCYMSMLPHIDGRKLNSPVKLYPFPWEEIVEEKIEKITQNEFDEAMKAGEEIIKKINNNNGK